MDHQLTAPDLLHMAGGEAFWRGLFSAIEGLAGRPRVRGNILFGEVMWSKLHRTQLQMAPPFKNRCTCSKGGNCRHVVTLGLAFLLQERQEADTDSFSTDYAFFHKLTMLSRDGLRGLALQLLASVPESMEVARKYLNRPGDYAEWDRYELEVADEECE